MNNAEAYAAASDTLKRLSSQREQFGPEDMLIMFVEGARWQQNREEDWLWLLKSSPFDFRKMQNVEQAIISIGRALVRSDYCEGI